MALSVRRGLRAGEMVCAFFTPAAVELFVYCVYRRLGAFFALGHFLCAAACVPAGGVGVFRPGCRGTSCVLPVLHTVRTRVPLLRSMTLSVRHCLHADGAVWVFFAPATVEPCAYCECRWL
jgi:hypothetical protein